MKKISRLIHYDDRYLSGKLPDGTMLITPNEDEDYPIFIKDDFLSGDECQVIIDQFLREGVADQPGKGSGMGVRKAYSYTLDGNALTIYQSALERVRPDIEGFFNTEITGSDGAHGLGYAPGFKYDLHADNCDPVLDEAGNLLKFERVSTRRQLSSLLFLTESVDELSKDNQHIGGNLSFRFLLDSNGEMLLIEPKPGLFVAFPSGPVFSHEVHEVYEVSSGFRMTIVNWYSCRCSGQ